MDFRTTSLKFRKHSVIFLFSAALFSAFVLACKAKTGSNGEYTSLPEAKKQDSLASIAAFKDVYSVLMHPRCMNCHPIGDIPLQGDDSHLHNMLPQRGPDGKGIASMKCANCHAPKGVPGDHTPPGNPKWHLPPADMKMVFQGKSARELALQLVNPELNGHKDMQALREHAEDTLVKSGWNMGGDRELPPLSYEEFKKVWYTWIDNGAYAPSN
ncbi:hypothetical protein [Aequorivita echinoideorum]|uniref:Cytochrome c domain-containing protein n=1 Tax=Aequorivita echinoideorum TaxID=1549647 RepID=A0ABS5S565_9FLAO|nr:hypothetical protein [Aequorivita echinoideorum]MBT0608362.1 hypothetical protein [Aequorivita echinoideorum]